MASTPVLVLGTHNRKKRLELEQQFSPLGLTLRTLEDFPNAIEVEEAGATFAENAALKATVQATHLRQWVLGEDSGLMVDALKGEPGVYSARFSGPDATDASNNRLLLERLQDIPLERRTAFYVCTMCLSDPAGVVHAESRGECHGRIRFDEAGAGGFGYDPLFEVVEYHRTFGELGGALKSIISHRARAARQLAPQLERLIASGQWTT